MSEREMEGVVRDYRRCTQPPPQQPQQQQQDEEDSGDEFEVAAGEGSDGGSGDDGQALGDDQQQQQQRRRRRRRRPLQPEDFYSPAGKEALRLAAAAEVAAARRFVGVGRGKKIENSSLFAGAAPPSPHPTHTHSSTCGYAPCRCRLLLLPLLPPLPQVLATTDACLRALPRESGLLPLTPSLMVAYDLPTRKV